MSKALIIGDGPAGLSAALFLAKNGVETEVFGKNETWLHKAMLYNYLGIPEITGPDFVEICRKQVADLGANLIDAKIEKIEKADNGFIITTDNGDVHDGKYVVIAVGPEHDLAENLGLKKAEHGAIDANREASTEIENVYVVGWTTRPDQVQAIISAGDGAAAALSILSKEKKEGKRFHDFDVLDD